MVKNVVLVIQDILGVLLGYLRCSSMNPEVKEEDAMGSYGFEDDDCCGIGETYIYDKKFRNKTKKKKKKKKNSRVSYNHFIIR
jgi:hypothetical protein